MEMKFKVKEKHNYVVINMSGDQSFVKIFDSSGNLIRHSQTKKAERIEQMIGPGEYSVETDGTVKKIKSAYIDLKAEEDLTQPTNP